MCDFDITKGVWYCAPPEFSFSTPNTLSIVTGEKKDFWQETFYRFQHDDGHFFGFEAPDNFTASIRVRGSFVHLYDQAGLMLRVDQYQWVKVGVEFTDGACFLSAVVTDQRSDWSLSQPFKTLHDFFVRLTLKDNALRIQASPDGVTWSLIRLAPFIPRGKLMIGPMACTPQRKGLSVTFSEFSIYPPIDCALHYDLEGSKNR